MPTDVDRRQSPEAPATRPRTKGFRPDIEGLRAVAVLAVLIFHAGVSFLPGGYVGVDVFFVISGFLITGLLVREIDSSGRISLPRFYAQRAKRLLPSLLLVLIVVAVLTRLVMPPVRQSAIAWDVLASGAYVINWKLAIASVDYFADSGGVSPLQHIWSLAVEEQFYLVWPALLLLAVLITRAFRTSRSHLVLVLVMASVSIASFGYNLVLTRAEAGHAYFSTLARGWELGLGGLLAMLLLVYKPGRRLSILLWVAGAAMIVFAAVRLDADTLFPGTAALLPTLGTAAIIAAGAASSEQYPQKLLTNGPIRQLGRVSYAWYLWHWPFVVFAAAIFGSLSAVQGLLVVAASYLPAAISTQVLENRIRHSPALSGAPIKALRLGLACTVLAVAAGIGLQVTVPRVEVAPSAQAPGASAMPTDRVQKTAKALRPPPDRAKADKGRMHADGCLVPKQETRSGDCVYGNPDSDTTVVLFGDSHAMMWFPALDKVAKKRDWRIIGLTKSGCQPADVTSYAPSFSRAYTECDQWRGDALKRIEREKPELTLTSSLTQYTVMDKDEQLDPRASRDALRDGYVRTLERLKRVSDTVMAIDDIPPPKGDVIDCVASNTEKLDRCARPRKEAVSSTPLTEATEAVDKAKLIRPASALCTPTTCPAVVGNVLVYRDSSHLSATYAATLDNWLAKKLPKRPGR